MSAYSEMWEDDTLQAVAEHMIITAAFVLKQKENGNKYVTMDHLIFSLNKCRKDAIDVLENYKRRVK